MRTNVHLFQYRFKKKGENISPKFKSCLKIIPKIYNSELVNLDFFRPQI